MGGVGCDDPEMGIADQDDETDLRREALTAGAALLGSVAAEGAGLLTAPPAAGMVTAVTAPILAAAAAMSLRVMTKRSQARVGAVVVAARAYAKESPLRDDGFFQEDHTGRSAAHEAIEAVLRIAERDPEERKIPHLGHLLACLATETVVGRDGAGWYVRTAGELSWNQLVLLSLIPESGGQSGLPAADVGSGRSWDGVAVHRELIDLGYGKRELVQWASDKTPTIGLKKPSQDMSRMWLREPARLLVGLLDLASVDPMEQSRVRAALEPAG